MKKQIKIAIGLATAGIGYLVWRNLSNSSDKKGSNGNNEFPIYPNPLCSDGVDGGCEFDQKVKDVQEFLYNSEYFDLQIDGYFGQETADTIAEYIEDSNLYEALGYNFVETPNYITLAFYESI